MAWYVGTNYVGGDPEDARSEGITRHSEQTGSLGGENLSDRGRLLTQPS